MRERIAAFFKIDGRAAILVTSTKESIEPRLVGARGVDTLVRGYNFSWLFERNAQRFGTHQQGSSLGIFIGSEKRSEL